MLQFWYSTASSCSHFCLVTQRSSSFVGEECCVTRQNTAARETSSARVTRRFNCYFINNNNNKKKKKKKINIITIININIDNNNNNNNNNSHEDLHQLLITEPQYRFWNSMHVVISEIIAFCVITLCVRKVITICVGRLLHFALKILLHFASMLLHFEAILITFCGVTHPNILNDSSVLALLSIMFADLFCRCCKPLLHLINSLPHTVSV